MSDNKSPNDKISLIYSEKAENFQALIKKAFQIYLKTGSYSQERKSDDE